MPRHPQSRMKLHCHDILGTTSWNVRGFSSCCTRFDTWARHQMVESAPALAYDALSSSTCGACCKLHGRSRISCSSTCRDTWGSACCDLFRSLCRYLLAATTSGPSGHVHGGCSDCFCAFFHVLDRAASSPAVTFLREAVKVAIAIAVTYF